MTDATILPSPDASRPPAVLQIVPMLAGGGIARAAVDTAAAVVAAGGRAVIAQWWDEHRDHNVLCPGVPPERVLDRWFTKF